MPAFSRTPAAAPYTGMLVIACATPAEAGALKNHITINEQKRYHATRLIRGVLADRELLLVITGIGPRNAKTAAQLISQHFRPAYVVLMGAAGAVDPSLRVCDIVIVDKILRKQGSIYHTQNISIEHSFSCHHELSRIAFQHIAREGLEPQWGNCLTTEHFIHLKAKKAWIYETFGVKLIEMESAALANIFYTAGIPFINIRVISDTAIRSIIDYEKIAGYKKRREPASLVAYFLQKPGAALKLIRFRSDMRKVRNMIARIAAVLAKDMPEQVKTSTATIPV